ncbi:MAG: OsmC family protein [Actinomycetota bacterium]
MGTQRLTYTGDRLQFIAEAGYGDPFAVGGDPEGPGAKPSDLLSLGLAACTAYDVVVILRKQRQDLRGLTVELTSEQEEDAPFIFTAIHLHFVLTGTIDEHKAARAIALSEDKYCSVAATIRPTVALTHSFEIRPVG